MTKPTALFIDDDPNILSGLRRLTRGLTERWNLQFLPSAEDALKAIEHSSVNLIVTDMRMPRMDGATLLEKVSQQAPGVFRFVLSGASDVEQTLRTVGRSHRFLAKPIEPEALFGAIDTLFSSDGQFLGQNCQPETSVFGLLKSTHGHLTTLKDILARPEKSNGEIAAQIMSDPSLSVRILQLSSSAYFGKPINTFSIPRTVEWLGTSRLAQLLENGSLGEEHVSGATGGQQNSLRAHAALIARQTAASAEKPIDEQELVYMTALFSGLGTQAGVDPRACSARPACIAALFGLPQLLTASLHIFGECHIASNSENDIAALAIESSARAIEQNKKAA